MSIDATRWAWKQQLPPSQKLVLLALADRADESHGCFPSINRMSRDTGLYRETIMEAIKQMEQYGLLSVIRSNGSGNRYALIGVEDRHTSSEKPTGRKKPTSRVKPTTPVGKSRLHQSVKADTNLSITCQEIKTTTPSVIDLMIADGVSKDAADDYLAHRKKLKADLSGRAWSHIAKQIRMTGMPFDDALSLAMARAWRGFEADWVTPKDRHMDQSPFAGGI